ncbi:MAG: double-stranded uracil-DNA glycosylase [Gaiellales bacterium]|nr:double-stranded uracil-DNA glycosylase [Gaiellales bacterium]
MAESTEPAAVPDVLAPGLTCIFCGINPGRVSAAAAAHFANPRNDFWRLLHDAGFTPRLYDPQEQFSLLALQIGITNAASRTTPGSGDLRRGDFDVSRLERIARELRPRAIAFVGKEAYRGAFRERPELGGQARSLGATGLFVLPSTSPANAAVPYAERLHWFSALREWLEPVKREAVRGLVLDRDDRVLLVRFEHPVSGSVWWATVGGGIDEGESDEQALRRELREEAGLHDFEIGPVVHEREHTFPWGGRIITQRERFYLVRVDAHEPVPTIDLAPEGVTEVRWWTRAELESPVDEVVPPDLPRLVHRLA